MGLFRNSQDRAKVKRSGKLNRLLQFLGFDFYKSSTHNKAGIAEPGAGRRNGSWSNDGKKGAYGWAQNGKWRYVFPALWVFMHNRPTGHVKTKRAQRERARRASWNDDFKRNQQKREEKVQPTT